jgi:hypothetical protein
MKNNDTNNDRDHIYPDLIQAIQSSQSKFLVSRFPEDVSDVLPSYSHTFIYPHTLILSYSHTNINFRNNKNVPHRQDLLLEIQQEN